MAGSVLTALTVAMSPFESRIVRIFAIIGFVLLIAFAPSFLGLWLGKAFATGSGALNTLRVYLCILAFVPAFIALCIEIAASRIAPAAENHSTAKRLIGLYFLLVPIPLGFTGMDMRALFLLATVFIAAVVIDALAEPMSTSLSVYRAFLKKGNLGTALSCIFSPGWASATFYVALLGLIGAPLLYLSGSLGDQAEMLGYLSFYGALIFPAALIRLFLPGTPIFLGLYVGTIFLCETFTLILGVMSNLGDKSFLLWLSPLPPSVFMFNLTGHDPCRSLGRSLRERDIRRHRHPAARTRPAKRGSAPRGAFRSPQGPSSQCPILISPHPPRTHPIPRSTSRFGLRFSMNSAGRKKPSSASSFWSTPRNSAGIRSSTSC